MNSLIKTNELKQQTKVYLDFLDNDLFYEGHEALEELWFPNRFAKEDNEVKVIRAYINAAVSFELVKRGREKSGLKPWGFFQKNLNLIEQTPKDHQQFYQNIYDKIIQTKERLNVFQNH